MEPYATFRPFPPSTEAATASSSHARGPTATPSPSDRTVRIGAVDIGTNSVRLLVADVDSQHRLRTAHRMGEISRLGEGLDRTGLIDEAAVARTLDCLERFVQEAEYSGASHIRVAATSAMRSASNGSDVASRFSQRIGYPVEILSGEEEARLVFLAVSSALHARAGRTVVIDIGGGSTEVIVGDGDEGRELISLPLGCVHLTERLISSDPPMPSELDAVRELVRGIYADCLSAFREAPIERAVGVGGTVTAFGALDMGLTKYDPSRIENHFLSRDRILFIEKELCAKPLNLRRELPGVSRGRADIIPAGSVILSEFVSGFPVEGLHVSTRGLRYGLVISEARRALPKPV